MIDLWATSTVAQCLETERSKSYAKFLDDYDVDLHLCREQIFGTWGAPKLPLSDAESPEDIESYGHCSDYDMFGYGVVVFMDARLNRID